MGNYCGSCGAELINDVCPNCTQIKQISYNQENIYQQQNMLCTVCGTQMINGICPRCTNQQMMNYQLNTNSVYNRFFMQQNERFVTSLGNSYIQCFLHHGIIEKGFAIVSDKRVYFHGTSYDVVHDYRGRIKASKSKSSQTVDLKDISGTGIKSTSNIGLKIAMIIVGIIQAFLFLTLMAAGSDDKYMTTWTGKRVVDSSKQEMAFWLITGIIIWLFLVIKYYLSKISLITIQYAGGEIAFDISWFPQQEVADFQRQVRLAKDRAIEESENSVANKFSQASSNINYFQGQTMQYNSADELIKYADLLQRGLITQEEYNNIRGRLING